MSNRQRLRSKRHPMSRVRPVELRESAPTLAVDEATVRLASTVTAISINEASAGTLTTSGGRRYRARLIESDVWGSSGYYSRKVVERDIPTVFPAGSSVMYLDHPTETEEAERPERSVRDLAARIVSTPVFERDGMYADIEVFPHAAPLIESLASTIGLSIRGGGRAEVGTIAGRTGPIIESITHGESVDFVTRAGAGGKLISLLEAARSAGVPVRESRNVGAYIESRLHLALTQIADDMYGNGQLTRDERIALSQAVGDGLTAWTARITADAPQLFERDIYDSPPDSADAAMSEARRLQEATAEETRQALCAAITDAYGVDDRNDYVWVRDYDAEKGFVWYDAPDSGEPQTWQQTYTATGTPLEVTLADTRVEVVARTVYDPAPADAEDAAENDSGVEEAARDQVAEAATTTDVTDGAPPTAPHPPTSEEPGMSGSQNTGQEPGAAGTTEAAPATSTTVTEASTTPNATEVALTESRRREADLTSQIARRDAVDTARPIAATILAESQLPAAAQAVVLARVTGQVPLTEANALDETAFRTAVTEAATAESAYLASLREDAGDGRITGLGPTSGPATADPAVQTSLAEAYIARGMSAEAAKLAAAGRP